MRDGPSEPSYRRRFQTTSRCCRQRLSKVSREAPSTHRPVRYPQDFSRRPPRDLLRHRLQQNVSNFHHPLHLGGAVLPGFVHYPALPAAEPTGQITCDLDRTNHILATDDANATVVGPACDVLCIPSIPLLDVDCVPSLTVREPLPALSLRLRDARSHPC
jgi:hypothetical protein